MSFIVSSNSFMTSLSADVMEISWSGVGFVTFSGMFSLDIPEKKCNGEKMHGNAAISLNKPSTRLYLNLKLETTQLYIKYSYIPTSMVQNADRALDK